jgi:hypothetical protein
VVREPLPLPEEQPLADRVHDLDDVEAVGGKRLDPFVVCSQAHRRTYVPCRHDVAVLATSVAEM